MSSRLNAVLCWKSDRDYPKAAVGRVAYYKYPVDFEESGRRVLCTFRRYLSDSRHNITMG